MNWVPFIFFALVAAILMAMPMLRQKRSVVTSSDATPAVLLDQLDEVGRDMERGLISAEEAQAAEQEIKRRMLVHARKNASAAGPSMAGGRVTLVLSAVFVPIFAAGYYAAMGAPEISSIAFAQRAEERQEAAQITDATAQLYEQLVNDPDGGPSEGWMMLGQAYAQMGRFSDAVNAFEIVSKRPEADSAVFSMLAEAVINVEQGVVTPRAETAIDRAIVLGPTNPAAVYYKAIALAQAGDAEGARTLLIERLETVDGFYPWMETLLGEANRIGAEIGVAPVPLARFAPMADTLGPTEEDVLNAQDMSEEDRGAFIRSMVDRLAARLEDAPDDLDGWMQLGNAYSVLGREDEAIAALEQAEHLLSGAPEADPRRQSVAAALRALRQ